MNTIFTLKNFRVFDNKQGGTFNLAPITILTGCNSSGKSSLVKSLLLVKDFFCQLEVSGGRFADGKLDFGNPLAKLGKFDIVRNSTSKKGSKMTFAYDIYSKKLGEKVQVELNFVADKKDILNNGWLDNILVKKLDNTTILAATIVRDKDKKNFFTPQMGALDISQRNIDCIKGNFWADTMKCLAFDTLYANADADINFINASLQKWFDGLSKLVSTEEILLFKEDLNNEMNSDSFRQLPEFYNPSKYSENYTLFLESVQLGTLFPMPIFKTLENVEKHDTRDTLYHLIENIAISVDRRELVKIKLLLDKVLDNFEKSGNNTLLDYFIVKEQEWLKSYTLQNHINWLGNSICDFSDFKETPDVDYGEVYRYIITDDGFIEERIDNDDIDHFVNLFGILYRVDRLLNEDGENYMQRSGALAREQYTHRVFAQFREYFASTMKEVLCPIIFQDFEYIADSFTIPKRIYTSENNELFGKLLFNYLEAIRTHEQSRIGRFQSHDFINKWMKKLQLGDHISISSTAEGLGAIVKIHKSPEDKQGRLLADEGFGITKIIGTLIYIEWAILKSYGKGVTIAIEEPENHLHPKYQSMLAEIFANAYKNYGIHFIVETHSEYMVRKLQTLVAKKDLIPAEVSLQYLYSPDVEQRPKGEPQVKNIPIREDGILEESFGPGFLDEADNLAMDILTIKAMC